MGSEGEEVIVEEKVGWIFDRDNLYFEMLNLKGMQRLWERKIHDLAVREFLSILEWVVQKKGKQVVYRDHLLPGSKMCSQCGVISTK
jgi:putative transposase